MVYYYKKQAVSKVRFFHYGTKSKAEITLNGKKLVVNANELTTNKPEQIVYGDKAVPRSSKELKEQPAVHKTLVKKQPVKEELSQKDNIETSQPKPNSELNRFSSFLPFTLEHEGKGVSVSISELSDLENVIKEYKLDLDAIERLLNKKQQTHKGFKVA